MLFRSKVKVAKTLVHPGYRVSTTDKGDVAINDLALLRLESPLPDAQSAPLPVANLSLAKDQMVLMAGFGRNGLEPSKEEILRDPEIRDLVESARRNPPKTKEEKEELSAQIMGILARRPLLTTPGLAYLSVLKGQAPFMTIFSTKGACGGDSGGPSYVVQNEGLMLLGVHSTSSNADCVNKKVSLANDMFVPAHLSWIRESMVKILE